MCPYQACRRAYGRADKLRDHLHDSHARDVPAAPAVEPMMDPPSDDDAPAQTFHPYWDYGPSETHTKSIKLLSEAEVRGLGGGESLVRHWKALMTHIETNSAPVLTRISADTAVQYSPLDEYTRQWKFVQEGIVIFIDNFSICIGIL